MRLGTEQLHRHIVFNLIPPTRSGASSRILCHLRRMNRKDFLRASGIAGLGAWWAGQAWASGGPVEAVDFEGKVKRAGIDGSAFDLAAEPLM